MRIIGCDLHSRQQTLAMLDTETGEVVKVMLMHEGHNGREFYSKLPRPVRVGIEATGSMQWFVNLLEELGIECLVGHPAEIRAAEPRKQKHDRRDADLILKLLAENRFPAIWMPSKELQDLRALLRHRHQWVRMRTRIQNALQSIALANGLRRGPALWTQAGQHAIASLPLAPHTAYRRSELQAMYEKFFIFVDYMRGSLRLSALMELPVIYVFTHDSIGVGEDGPTHQPIEQLAHMRSTPGLIVIRPADANEVSAAWKVILQLHHEPAVLVLTRQAVPTIDRTKYAPASGLARGAYVLADAPGGDPEVIIIGTGSEVALCVQAYEQLTKEGVRARIVSMPSWELFDDQDRNYRESVLPRHVKARVSVEQASDFGWSKYTSHEGYNICIETFGASAPLKQLMKKFGFSAENIVAAAKQQIAQHQARN